MRIKKVKSHPRRVAIGNSQDGSVIDVPSLASRNVNFHPWMRLLVSGKASRFHISSERLGFATLDL